MDKLLIAYSILGGFTLLGFLIFIIKVAGKDILFSIYRRFRPLGNEVFIVNPNRQISRYYAKAKDGVFRIDDKIYITNPNKLLTLTDEMKRDISEKLSLARKRLQKNIDKMELKKKIIIKQIESIENEPKYLSLLDGYKIQLTELDNRIELLKSKLKQRQQRYFMEMRGAYFYVEGDPVPKDFYEFYTEMDSVQIENVIVRAQTKDPKMTTNIEASLIFIKRFLIFALIGSAVAGFFAFQNHSYIQQLAQNMGVTLSL